MLPFCDFKVPVMLPSSKILGHLPPNQHLWSVPHGPAIWSSWVLSEQTTGTGIGTRVCSGLSYLGDGWSYDHHFSIDGYVLRIKSYWGFYKIKIFILKYVLDHSKSILVKKLDPKFLSLPFFRNVTPYFKKMAVSRGKSKWDFFFEIEIFILKYVLDHSASIPIQKIWPKIFVFAIFFDQNWPKLEVFW